MFGKSKGNDKLDKDWWVAILFLLPSFILFCMFSYYPFFKTILNSFSITSAIGEFIKWAGLKNWQRVLSEDMFLKTIKNTFVFAAYDFVLTFSTSMFFALLSARKERGAKLYQTLFAMPMAIAGTTIASIGLFVFRGENGLLNQIVGGDMAWLRESSTAMICLAFITSWGHIAGSYIYLMVGFRNVSEDLIEAATIDGAGWWRRTFRIMIPMASPQIFYVLFTRIIGAFKTFTQIKLLTWGGPAGATTTLIWSVYDKYNSGQISISCCYALVLFVIIFIATRIQFAFEKKMVFYQ